MLSGYLGFQNCISSKLKRSLCGQSGNLSLTCGRRCSACSSWTLRHRIVHYHEMLMTFWNDKQTQKSALKWEKRNTSGASLLSDLMRIYEIETLWDGGRSRRGEWWEDSWKFCQELLLFFSWMRPRNMLLSLSLQTVPLMLNSYVFPLVIETAAQMMQTAQVTSTECSANLIPRNILCRSSDWKPILKAPQTSRQILAWIKGSCFQSGCSHCIQNSSVQVQRVKSGSISDFDFVKSLLKACNLYINESVSLL